MPYHVSPEDLKMLSGLLAEQTGDPTIRVTGVRR